MVYKRIRKKLVKYVMISQQSVLNCAKTGVKITKILLKCQNTSVVNDGCIVEFLT